MNWKYVGIVFDGFPRRQSQCQLLLSVWYFLLPLILTSSLYHSQSRIPHAAYHYTYYIHITHTYHSHTIPLTITPSARTRANRSHVTHCHALWPDRTILILLSSCYRSYFVRSERNIVILLCLGQLQHSTSHCCDQHKYARGRAWYSKMGQAFLPIMRQNLQCAFSSVRRY
jgi:hypothetical protein